MINADSGIVRMPSEVAQRAGLLTPEGFDVATARALGGVDPASTLGADTAAWVARVTEGEHVRSVTVGADGWTTVRSTSLAHTARGVVMIAASAGGFVGLLALGAGIAAGRDR